MTQIRGWFELGLGWAIDNFFGIVMGLLGVVVVVLLINQLVPITGTIAARLFVPQHWETHYQSNCTLIGKINHCISIPYQVHVDDAWSIEVCNEHRCKWIALTEVRYADTRIGEHYSDR